MYIKIIHLINCIHFFSHNVPIGNLICGKHDLFKLFLKTACKLLIYSYVNHINRILSKGEKNNCTSDPIKPSDISYHEKYSKKKSFCYSKMLIMYRQNHCIIVSLANNSLL